jgi:hypothetical protein
MTFQNYVCWQLKQVEKILNVEAIQPPDHIFLATHHPIKMKQNQLIKELINDNAGVNYNEAEFLQDFLAPQDFAFVPILGNSGTGKSHLIRWLAAKIESTDKRKVLLIPKIGTNLKDIIRMILDIPELQEPKFEEYRKRLERATNTLTENEAREQLLNQLAIAVKRERPNLNEIQEYLVEELHNLLYDPYFRQQHWLKNGSIIHKLSHHILGHQDTLEIIETRQEFSLNDIPLNILDLQKSGAKAQDFYGALIGDDDLQKETVNWLNLNLDQAIAKVLDLGTEDLQILMREVRESLAEKQIELVLLIEDFAKLQGIDREVLEAVLARPQQAGSKPLCAMRTAFACTTGYFRGLISSYDTVQQRVTFSVNLDVGIVSDQALFSQADIQEFTARYLNAIRLDETAIIAWANDQKETDLNRQEIPNYCEECPHRQPCHQGFGQVKGMGLYPFTPTALQQMLTRVNQGEFNPRIFLKDVLKYALENSVIPIQEGRFPTKTLQEHFGKMRLSAIVQDEIRQKDPINGERRQILLDLWTDSDTIVDLPTEIHTAFNIPSLGVTENKPIKPIQSKEKIEPYKVIDDREIIKTIPDKLQKQLEILNNWNNQGILPQDIEGDIRNSIYPAILERIEWDTEMLIRGNFASSTSIFKQRNVLIYSPRKRGEGANYSGIVLTLPLNPDDETEFRETAIAFQGILQYNHYQHWNFDNGDRYFRAYARQLERWSDYIIEQIYHYPRQCREKWNPIPATVELLALAAKMSGHPSNSIEDLINSLFLELEDKDLENRGKTWRELFKHLQTNQNKLLDILKSYIGCTKGSRTNFQMIDTVQILQSLKTISKNWQPQQFIPDDLNKEYDVITKVRQKVDQLLINVLEEEAQRQLKIYDQLVAEFGKNVNKKEVIDLVKQAVEEARNAGVFGQKTSENLTQVIDQFQRTRFSKYLETMERIKAEQEKADYQVTNLLPYLSETYQKAMTDAENFLTETNKFLTTSLEKANQAINDLQSVEGGNVESNINAIRNGLTQLEDLLQQI